MSHSLGFCAPLRHIFGGGVGRFMLRWSLALEDSVWSQNRQSEAIAKRFQELSSTQLLDLAMAFNLWERLREAG